MLLLFGVLLPPLLLLLLVSPGDAAVEPLDGDPAELTEPALFKAGSLWFWKRNTWG